MNSIEFDTTDLIQNFSDSLQQTIERLEKCFRSQDLTEEEKKIETSIKTEIYKIIQEQQLASKIGNQTDSEELNKQKQYAKKISDIMSSILKQYSNNLTEEIRYNFKQVELFYKASYSFFELIENFREIKKSFKSKNIFSFLQKIHENLLLVAEQIEDNGKLILANLPFADRMTKKNLIYCKQIIKEKIDKYRNQLAEDKKALKEIDRKRRLIDRTINSTLWYLDKYKQEIEEENREKERLEKEQKSLESLKAWVEEDQLKDLTKEELEEEDLVMKMMEEDRKKEQLAKNQKALELIKSWIERDETTTVTQEEREENDLLLEIIDANRERKLFSKE